MRAVGELGQSFGAGAEIVVSISEIGLDTDQADGQTALALADPLEDAGIQHRRLVARIGADQQDGVGLLDAFDRRIEQIRRAAERRIELGAVLAAIDIGRAELLCEKLQREHLLGRAEVAGYYLRSAHRRGPSASRQ